MSTIPQVFLSLSGRDDTFVERVWRQLPHGLAMYYRKSFDNGEKLLEEMERCVGEASLFVLFASKASVESVWVGFELDQARLSKIQAPSFKILVFPISSDIVPNMLPRWMQQFWIQNAGFSARDVARFIKNALTIPPLAPPTLAGTVIGRGQFQDHVTQRTMAVVAETGKTPNVMIFAGINGIGRRTCARHFIKQSLGALPHLAYGPEFLLPEFCDISDLYRALREQIENDFSITSFENDLRLFRELSQLDQVSEIIKSIQYFGTLGQALFMVMGSGLMEDQGNLKAWVRLLFGSMSNVADVMICFISNRQVREEDLRQYENVVQFHVPPLKDADVRALMIATSAHFDIKRPIFPDNLVHAIGGHAQVAKAAVRLIAQRGAAFLDKRPDALFSIQDEILSENLDVDLLSDLQKEILSILSWVPQLDGGLLENTLKMRRTITDVDFVGAIDNLILGCLVLVSDNLFTISAAIRHMFRRKHGYGDTELIEQFSKVLRQAWEESMKKGEFSNDLFDAFVFMHALEGKSLPMNLRKLLLPSTLREVMSDAYARGRDEDSDEDLRRVVTWGSIADQLTMDETIREEIFSIVAHAHIRLRDYKSADKVIDFIARKGYRSAAYLQGYSRRRQGRFGEAIPFLRDAVATRKQLRAAVRACDLLSERRTASRAR